MSHYTAKVSHGQVVIRDVGLPDGTEVSVTIERGRGRKIEQLRFSPEVEADIKESLAQHRRGETISGEESIADLRRFQAVLDSRERARRRIGTRGRAPLASKPRTGTKSSRRRAP